MNSDDSNSGSEDRKEGYKTWRRPVTWLNAVFLWPVTIPSVVVGRLLGLENKIVRPMPDSLQSLVENRLKAILVERGHRNEQPDVRAQKVFPFVYHYVLENAPMTSAKLLNHIAQSGFLRTISLISSLSCWAVLVPSVSSKMCPWSLAAVVAILVVVAYSTFLGFLKFNRRFVFEAYVGLATTDLNSEA